MANGTNNDGQGCQLQAFERNRYFYGKLLTTRDFETEQRYLMEKDHLINKLIHGAGIVCGLTVSAPAVEDGKLKLTLTAGVALDCCGNEIVISRESRVTVTVNLKAGSNYVYLKYFECEREPVPALANASTCEETCAFNRIQEGYQVVVSPDPPLVTDATFSGKVTEISATGPVIWGAKLEALQGGVVKASTFTDNVGQFTLHLAAGTYSLRATATGFQPQAKSLTVSTTLAANFSLAKAAPLQPSSLCEELTERYYDEHLRVCPACGDPKVLLAVVTIAADGTPSLDEAETAKHRSIVHSNKMLDDLLCDHLADFNNPHQTTAQQVGALKSINGVGNVVGKPYVSNIDLVCDEPSGARTITITKDPVSNNQQVGVKLAADSVKRTHLNADVINNLVASADAIGTTPGTITVTPVIDPNNPSNKQIEIKTNPAISVTSVGAGKVIGDSLRYAPDDHAHDLADKVVTTAKLDDNAVTKQKIINSAVDGDKLADSAVLQKHLSDDLIRNLITSDGTITVTPIVGTKQIKIASTSSGTPPPTARTGMVTLTTSPTGFVESKGIVSGFTDSLFCVCLGVAGLPNTHFLDFIVYGAADLIIPNVKLAALVYTKPPNRGKFDIRIQGPKDTRFTIHWVAIPAVQQSLFIGVLPRIQAAPGISARDLAKELGVELGELEAHLKALREAGQIRLDGDKLFPI